MRPIWLLLVAAPALAATHPLTFDDMIHARRVESFDVSPDGKWLAYALTTMNVDENRGTTAIWLQPLDAGEPRQLTSGHKHDRDPRFSPDGKRLAFTSDRDGAPQIQLLDLAGGEPRALTHLPGGADDYTWSPDGRFLVAASEVYPECRDEKCNKERFERKPPSTGRVVSRLLFRHWDTWRDGRRAHLFRVDAATGDALDLTPGDFDSPPFAVHGARAFDVSPDGKHVVFASNRERVEATSTNADLFEVPSGGGAARALTDGNRAFDGAPRYAPDGRTIAYLAQKIPGYESDRFELMLYDRDKRAARSLTARFDNWVDDFAWAPDGRSLWFTSVSKARAPLYQVSADGGAPKEMLGGVTAGDPLPLRDGSVLFARSSLGRPVELARFARGEATAVTHVNDALFATVEMGAVRERWYQAADGNQVHALVVLPPRFDEKKKWPALFLVHGGPQGAWVDGWTYRWNAQAFAAMGYVVYLPNPRGSTGYGQAFVRGVSGEWGGRTFDDLMRGADDLASLPFVDGRRIGAAGASFGGYMINWFQGHTTRFRALFCHDGIADTESGYATEELWFPEFEFGGVPWASPLYRKWNPIAAAAEFKTPQLIVHGERDYRIPVEQAYLMFTALQRRGVPSKLLVFPDENHWVLKPANARLWYATFQDWFHQYLGGAPADAKALETAASVTR